MSGLVVVPLPGRHVRVEQRDASGTTGQAGSVVFGGCGAVRGSPRQPMKARTVHAEVA